MKSWWVSCKVFTVQVDTDENGIIVAAAPIIRKFLGQPFSDLLSWGNRLGGLKHQELNGRPPAP